MQLESLRHTYPSHKIRISQHSNIPRRYINSLHYHPEFELLYILNGKIRCYNEEMEVIAKQGDILFVNARIPHADERLELDTKYILLQFRERGRSTHFLPELSEFLQKSDIPICIFTQNDSFYQELLDYLLSIFNHSQNNIAATDYFILSGIYAITGVLVQNGFYTTVDEVLHSPGLMRLLPIFDYIDQHYADPINPQVLASELQLSESYFCRLFKKTLRATPSEYVNFVRISKADQLFSSEMNLSEIAYALGFSSLSYFDRTFKRFRRCSPSTYRKIFLVR